MISRVGQSGGLRGVQGVSIDDAIADFIAAMEAEGMRPVDSIGGRLASGELIRFRCDGDGRGRDNGWAILYFDERPAGAFGNYRLGLSRKWVCGRDGGLSPVERERLQREWQRARKARIEERTRSELEAAKDAGDMWGRAQPASPDHPYLTRKGMAADGFRQLGDVLLVPMFDAEGAIQNIQRIMADGTKRFLRGGRTAGLFHIIGEFTRRGETACIGEGLATMAAVHRASGFPCIVAFSAKNLLPVARLWWAQRPDLDFIVCGDDDTHLQNNVGRVAAEAAAAEIGARLTFPTAIAA